MPKGRKVYCLSIYLSMCVCVCVCVCMYAAAILSGEKDVRIQAVVTATGPLAKLAH